MQHNTSDSNRHAKKFTRYSGTMCYDKLSYSWWTSSCANDSLFWMKNQKTEDSYETQVHGRLCMSTTAPSPHRPMLSVDDSQHSNKETSYCHTKAMHCNEKHLN